jgi:hypothetical protein
MTRMHPAVNAMKNVLNALVLLPHVPLVQLLQTES